MSVLEGGAQLVDAQVALGQTRRAREDELGQERAAVCLDDDAVGSVFHLDVGGHFVCSVVLLFLRFRSVFFYLAERMPARGWLREWLSGLASRFGRFLYPLGAHLLQAAFENSKLFLGLL